jgi:hypothetical protein
MGGRGEEAWELEREAESVCGAPRPADGGARGAAARCGGGGRGARRSAGGAGVLACRADVAVDSCWRGVRGRAQQGSAGTAGGVKVAKRVTRWLRRRSRRRTAAALRWRPRRPPGAPRSARPRMHGCACPGWVTGLVCCRQQHAAMHGRVARSGKTADGGAGDATPQAQLCGVREELERAAAVLREERADAAAARAAAAGARGEADAAREALGAEQRERRQEQVRSAARPLPSPTSHTLSYATCHSVLRGSHGSWQGRTPPGAVSSLPSNPPSSCAACAAGARRAAGGAAGCGARGGSRHQAAGQHGERRATRGRGDGGGRAARAARWGRGGGSVPCAWGPARGLGVAGEVCGVQ